MGVDIRADIKRLIKDSGISVRGLSIKSGVRRQSIMRFFSGGSIHTDNLQKIVAALGYEFSIVKKNEDVSFEKRLKVDRAKLKKFCKENGIASVFLFGSVLRSDFTKESDIDVIIKMGKPITFFELAEIEAGLQKLLGTKHRLDIVTEEGISPLIRDDVERQKEALYNEAAKKV